MQRAIHSKQLFEPDGVYYPIWQAHGIRHKGHGQKMHKGARMHQHHNGHPQPMQHGPVEKA